MSRRTELTCIKKTLLLYEEDWQFLSEHYGAEGLHSIGVTPIIREIIHRKVGELRDKMQQKLDQREKSDA